MNGAYRGELITMICKATLLFLVSLVPALGIGCTTAANAPIAAAEHYERIEMANTKSSEPVTESVVRDVKLESKISVSEDEIRVSYSVTNNAAHDVYVLDAYPAVEQSSRTAYADLKSFYLSFREPATAFILKGIPPLPSDKTVTVRVMPLGTKVGPSGKLNRELSIALPLRERSDWYYAPLPPEEYKIGAVNRLVFNVQFLRSTVEGFDAKPAHYAEDFFIVRGNSTVKQAETLAVEFNIERSQIFIRKDLFNRL